MSYCLVTGLSVANQKSLWQWHDFSACYGSLQGLSSRKVGEDLSKTSEYSCAEMLQGLKALADVPLGTTIMDWNKLHVLLVSLKFLHNACALSLKISLDGFNIHSRTLGTFTVSHESLTNLSTPSFHPSFHPLATYPGWGCWPNTTSSFTITMMQIYLPEL